jgi:hypothetical protein
MLAIADISLVVKVRDVITDWPLRKWTADDPSGGTLGGEPGHLRLLWFSAPDSEGWFRVTATDQAERGWSTFCRVEDPSDWRRLEITLSGQLRASLADIGGLDLPPLHASAAR